MKTSLLSDLERKLLSEYLLEGKTSPQLRVLKHRIRKHYEIIFADYELISQANLQFK